MFGSNGGQTSLHTNFFSSALESPARDMSFFDSVGSTGSGFPSRPLFSSHTHASSRYTDLMATDPGLGNDYDFLSNNELSRCSLMEPSLFKSSGDIDYELPRNEFQWQGFDDKPEDIDVLV